MAHGLSPKKLAVIRRRSEVQRLYFDGLTQEEIAFKFNISQRMVSKDLSIIREEWKRERLALLDERIDLELAKIDALEIEYRKSWERSKRNAETLTVRVKKRTAKGKAPAGDETETSKKDEGQVGNPQFLAGIRECILLRLKLLDYLCRPSAPPVKFRMKEWELDAAIDELLQDVANKSGQNGAA